jgi:hypothetical protein
MKTQTNPNTQAIYHLSGFQPFQSAFICVNQRLKSCAAFAFFHKLLDQFAKRSQRRFHARQINHRAITNGLKLASRYVAKAG